MECACHGVLAASRLPYEQNRDPGLRGRDQSCKDSLDFVVKCSERRFSRGGHCYVGRTIHQGFWQRARSKQEMRVTELERRGVAQGSPLHPTGLKIRSISRTRVLDYPHPFDSPQSRVQRRHPRIGHRDGEPAHARTCFSRERAFAPPPEYDLVDGVEAVARRACQGSVAFEDDVQIFVARRSLAL
jgi:hypothetical protein